MPGYRFVLEIQLVRGGVTRTRRARNVATEEPVVYQRPAVEGDNDDSLHVDCDREGKASEGREVGAEEGGHFIGGTVGG